MDSNDDSLLAESEDSLSDQETDNASSESCSYQKPSNKILILSAESLSALERKSFDLPSELELDSCNLISKSGLNASASNTEKRNPLVIKAQPILNSRHILLPESSSFLTAEEQDSQNVYNCEKKVKKRERNVTKAEKRTLIKICKNYPELNDKVTNNETNNRKRIAWERIQKEFIATSSDPESKDRSIKFLQGCFSRFRKERRKARRALEEGKKTDEEFSDKHSTSSLYETESHLPSSLEETPSGKGVNVHTLVSGNLLGANSSAILPLSDYDVMLGSGNSLVNGVKADAMNPLFVRDSNRVSVVNGTSKASLSNTNSESVPSNQPTKLCSVSPVLQIKPMSIRSLRRKALELAVEVEKEKLAALRYQKEAEQERLAAMKLQKSAQRYAEMVERERYETELLKKEAARLLLEREKLL